MNLESPFWSARGRAFCTRLTLTRFTLLYFTFALIACLILVALEGVTLAGNRQGTQALSNVLSQVNTSQVNGGLPLFWDDKLLLCNGIPDQLSADCRVIRQMNPKGHHSANGTSVVNARGIDEGHSFVDTFSTRVTVNRLVLSDDCIYSLEWLLETVQDGIREDIVTLCFQFWLFSLAFVTLVTESIPHLGAGLFGHLLGTAWAGYRVHLTSRLESVYRDSIVPDLCANMDFMGNWWSERRAHGIGIIVVYSCTLVALMYLSHKLLTVYAHQSFARVGAPNQIRQIYKIILLFSAGLQLTLFFFIASIGLWLGKINQGTIRIVLANQKSLLAVLIVALVLLIPWLILGWICVRRECGRRYGVFCVISLFFVVLFSVLFSTSIYRFLFISSHFFATITMTSYLCVVTTAILGIICRFNFGKGLVHYLEVDKTLAGMNFTEGTFYDHKVDPENGSIPSINLPNGVESKHDSFIDGHVPSRFSMRGGTPIKLSSTPAALKNLILVPDERLGITNEKQSTGISLKDVLPPLPSPAWVRRPLSAVSNSGSILTDVPLRLTSLVRLREELDEFPSPPTGPSTMIASRYAPRFNVPLDIKDGRVISVPKRG